MSIQFLSPMASYPQLDGNSNVPSQESNVYNPQPVSYTPYYEQAPVEQARDRHQSSTKYRGPPVPPKRNPCVVVSQISCCTVGCILLVAGVIFAVCFLSFGSAITSYHVDYDDNISVPFQERFSVNGTLDETGFYNFTLGAGLKTEDLSKMRMCIADTSTISGVAQAQIPFSVYEYPGAYDIPECNGNSAQFADGVALCTTATIFVQLDGLPRESFTVDIYYDYCHSEYEDCICDYVGFYLAMFLVFIFSVGFAITCLCCACCCSLCCFGACGFITLIDHQNRSRAESYALVANM